MVAFAQDDDDDDDNDFQEAQSAIMTWHHRNVFEMLRYIHSLCCCSCRKDGAALEWRHHIHVRDKELRFLLYVQSS